MRTTFLCALLAGLAAAPLAAPAIDFTPRFSTMTEGGGVLRRLYFDSGEPGAPVLLSPDSDTEVSGGSGEAHFRFSVFEGASLVLRRSPHEPALPFEGEGLATYRTTALSYAPSGMQPVGEMTEIENPLAINGWTGRRFVMRYQIPGSQVSQSVTFLNLNAKEQIVLVATGYEQNFGEITGRVDALMRSWRVGGERDLQTPAIN